MRSDLPEGPVPADALPDDGAGPPPAAPPVVDPPAAGPPAADPPVEAAAEGPLKALLKEALADALREQRQLLQSIVEDALQELALAEAAREVEAHERRFGRHAAGFRSVEGEA